MNDRVSELQKSMPKHSMALMCALWTCWTGISVAIGAAVFVWFSRGQIPVVMLFACLFATDISLRIYFRHGIFGQQNGV